MHEEDSTTAYLVDASIYIFRAWFSLPEDIVALNGNPANAVFGFARFCCEVLEQAQPSHIAMAWDESLASSFRNEIYPEYKANRDPAPPELKAQFGAAREFCEAMGIFCTSSSRYEADDLIATLAHRARKENFRTAIVTADKDLGQVLIDDDFIWDFARKRFVTCESIKRDMGVRAEQIPDFLALAGDSVDNIPGLTGIGVKTAVALLAEFDDLESVYAGLEAVRLLPIRGVERVYSTLDTERDRAALFKRLTCLTSDAPIEPDYDIDSLLARSIPDWAEIERLIDEWQLGRGLKDRLERACELI